MGANGTNDCLLLRFPYAALTGFSGLPTRSRSWTGWGAASSGHGHMHIPKTWMAYASFIAWFLEDGEGSASERNV
jgi:hypothetical protein